MGTDIYDFVVVDSKSRITIPLRIRRLLGIREGMKLMITANSSRKEIRIIPLVGVQAKVNKLRVLMADRPGVLARVATILADNNVDLLLTESRTVRRGELAEWVIIADLTNCKSISELVEEIKKLDFVKEVEISEID
ncbi:MAG: AbrB family transcriptional regulator [Thermoproteota archaeon]|jgi:AbrB family looped-hinge helix DNA binding protein|uniref:ACT domain-containing protein n=1 Tax=Candidatus Methanodesulfokora washburnensis TaxID=2478471 RepID=A0A429GR64_9CREN|nr:ACT domain-containing protein [Candidatus Methanodesulfokores washburnensis]RSN76221.1 ACT domain-containing protein [Candidatus Methanodesulfokores washburnensis]RZN62407.1 MAG: ACT domain-containing protein [Candidatus Methanodesulfokores washburnensis]TDA38265.1 MAG: AbrB family transcriptional regulator [Candidatus Korarchaeota archaeon]